MKRVKCPKCDNYLVFDETKYNEGQALVFRFGQCKKEFGIRIGQSKLAAIHEEKTLDEHQYDGQLGAVTVVENKFAFKQVIPLQMGDNYFGRYLKGTDINKPIITSDPSVDTFHCVINVRRDKNGGLVYTLRDAPSNTGTFVMDTLLRDNERRVIKEGDIISIGATTLIFHAADSDSE